MSAPTLRPEVLLAGRRPPGAVGQVAALVSLRVAALRGRSRLRVAAGLALVPVTGAGAIVAGLLLPRSAVVGIQLLLPSAWLLFAVSAVVGTTTGAGSRRLLPRAQTVAFPLSPAAEHLAALLLAPVSLAWLVQAIGLLGLTAWVVGPTSDAAPALALTALWIVTTTIVGQTVGWLVDLLRSTRAGVWALRGVVLAGVASAVSVGLRGQLGHLLDRVPTQRFVYAALFDAPASRSVVAVQFVGASIVAWVAGVRLLAWVQRRPARDQARTESRAYRRAQDTATAWAAMLRLDRHSVWRSAPLRRGLAVLALVPGGAAGAAGLDWPMIALLPGLVASGAGLLFGVNAFALDSSGALWRESVPGSPRTMLLVRVATVAEVCLAGALLTVVAAAWRAGLPTAAQAVAVAGAMLATTAQVVRLCARWSVRRPYAAELRDAHDQPAPPAAMAGYSARLAVSTTWTGLLFVLSARVGSLPLALGLTAGFVLLTARSLVALCRDWADPQVRSDVLATVSGARA